MKAVLPGGTVGILGGGQLARMMAFEARRMGYRVGVLDPDGAGPAAQVADFCVDGALDDVDAARALAARVDVVTLDVEHIPASLLDAIASEVCVQPAPEVFRVVQDRAAQREFLARHGLPQTRNAVFADEVELAGAGSAVGFPCILKTRREGYDGKGQVRVERPDELVAAWDAVSRAPALLEALVEFEREISVVLARGASGEIAYYPIAENEHRNHVLHVTRAPARVTAEQVIQAHAIGHRIAQAFDYIGVLAVELFACPDGSLLVNEIAPRTHNSGHYTYGACVTSQFEQHIRAVCGLPLGAPDLLRPALMVNLLGDLWDPGPPDWAEVLRHPHATLHLYGKTPPSPGRKMGHVVFLDDDLDHAATHAQRLIDGLTD